jgi:hypothetical protein
MRVVVLHVDHAAPVLGMHAVVDCYGLCSDRGDRLPTGELALRTGESMSARPETERVICGSGKTARFDDDLA